MKPLLKALVDIQRKLAQANLRTKLLLVFILPMIVILFLTSYIHIVREQKEWVEISEQDAAQLAGLALKGIKHTFLDDNPEMTARMLTSFAEQDQIQHILIVNNDGQVVQSSVAAENGIRLDRTEPGCLECHQEPPSSRPKAIRLTLDNNTMRIATLIPNEEECQVCHAPQDAHLGILLIDKSFSSVEKYLWEDAFTNIVLTIFSVTVIALVAYLMIRWLVERRITVVANALSEYTAGNFSIRIQKIWHTEDEVTRLADQFNLMADSIEKYSQEKLEAAMVRQKAIIDERERIARELHDSLPQLLAYLIAKIGAIRLLIEQGKKPEAITNLDQLESASRSLFNDVREAIIGLRMSHRIAEGLIPAIQAYIDQFTQFCGLPVTFETDPGILRLQLDPEMQIHVLRIVQEAMSNIRKHAGASLVRVELKLQVDTETMVIMIQDNGRGFDFDAELKKGASQFGLHTMRERAETLGGVFELDSKPGQGTLITLKMPVSISHID